MLRTIKRFNSTVTSQNIKKTALFNLHEELGAKMVPFAGYSMPLLYPTLQNHVESHHWVRQKAGLFDVSHMLQSKISGDETLSLLNKVTPTDFSLMPMYNGSLSVLLNSNGGIIDDLIIIREPGEGDCFHVVSNAARSKEVTTFLNEEIKTLNESKINFKIINDEALLALQGPMAAESLNKLVDSSGSKNDLKELFFGQRKEFILKNGIIVNVMRGGYTGEDGFEIAVKNNDALAFAKLLLSDSNVKPIGLAARDSLRLEAGMCLYGNELDMTTTPVEANLNWLISKTRRVATDNNSSIQFNGFSTIMDQLNNKSWTRRRIGFQYIDSKPSPAARHNDKIFNQDKTTEIGIVTSGSISPTLNTNIGQGYLKKGYTKTGNQYFVQVRKKFYPIEIKKMPFVPSHYYKG
ncbi:similar to Saccharomyces cerevisiae YDR019C GCV1 T subunit of the mitochondrial glycine decarboxylase complex, required for the catabolism of glycine to 5,10-methylene-THF [Maudiozyma saulgeensis]|uniref:Aminomethyltransferase n=1 Tax=Maudiozyma saulgeensis TaxID=1789683 RepID=A0A1X7R411_9SACH|nr:similar to Saccharomyces cerevisiae YDR019C GCV1 T subunit of the mitochondrial glycine decarboxylase complex, required for the catabolism of glycine to 5,10-methylene-THF [Kazachstania saulgeensis]